MFRAFDHLVWALFILVESCSIKFDRDQTIHWTNVERLSISFVFRDVEWYSVRLTNHWTIARFARAQCVIVNHNIKMTQAKFSLVQHYVQYVWPHSNWRSLNNTQLYWTNVHCCSVKCSVRLKGALAAVNFPQASITVNLTVKKGFSR